MRLRVMTCVIALVSAAVMSCNWSESQDCTTEGYVALKLDIRDTQGNSLAVGSLVDLIDGSEQEHLIADADPSWISGGKLGRTYDVMVSRRYYYDTWVRGVKTNNVSCGKRADAASVTRKMTITLPLDEGAPPVRGLYLFPLGLLLDRAPQQSTGSFTPYLDVAPGVSRGVLWRIAGDTASVSLNPATGVLQYRCRAQSGIVTLTATAAADTSVHTEVTVRTQGHPAAVGDPPCS